MDSTVLLIVGMAGSGKTWFTQRLCSHMHSKNQAPFVINLDPAVYEVPYATDIDVRDVVDYKNVMKEYGLGPNGGIMTCLNLFAAQFDLVLDGLGSFNEPSVQEKLAIVDTPGQIEIFTWSASGSIITETLASIYPTVVVYVVDTTKCQHPATFMANMLYACNILYKTRLPLVVVFNKIDETSHEFALEWMADHEKLQEAVYSETSFMASFNNSMGLMLEEFYTHLKVVGVSSLTGENMDLFLGAVKEARQIYAREYRPEIEQLKREREKSSVQEDLQKLVRDISLE